MYKDLVRDMNKAELGREVATITRLYRVGKPDLGKLDILYQECMSRDEMEIFHDAQEREFARTDPRRTTTTQKDNANG